MSFIPQQSIQDLPAQIPAIETTLSHNIEDIYDNQSDSDSVSPLIPPSDRVNYSHTDIDETASISTPTISQNIDNFYTNQLKNINERFIQEVNSVKISYENSIQEAQTILNDNLGNLKSIAQNKIAQVNNNLENDSLAKLINSISINDLEANSNIDENLQIFIDLKSSLNDIRTEYINKKEKENNKYRASASQIAFTRNTNMQKIKQDYQKKLVEFQAGLSNLADITQQIESMKRHIANYRLS